MKQFKSLIFLCFFAVGLGAQDIYQKVDEFKGTALYFTKREQPKLQGGSFFSRRYVYMQFIAHKPAEDPSIAYSIMVDASLPDWMFIRDGESLVLKADGQTVALSGPGSASSREVVGPEDVNEAASWFFPLRTLEQLARAKAIQFRIYGDRSDLTGAFTEDQMAELRLFEQKAPGLIQDSGASNPLQPKVISETLSTTNKIYRAGIRYIPGPHWLQVLLVEPGSPNASLLQKFILAIEGERGTGIELQAKLNAVIAKHQDGTPVKITLSGGPGEPEKDAVLALAAQ